ncbi:MAG: Lipopolysaccharide heptosyltransferase 1 [Pseudomonadota bacterium]
MKVLVVKMSSMGDIVHAQPVVSDLLAHAPDASIDWVAEVPFAGIPAMNPGVARVIPIAWRKWRRSLREPATRAAMRAFRDRVREIDYDWIVDCQGLLKSAAVARLARGAHRVGPSWSSAREPLASLAYDRRAVVPWSLHVVARNRAIAAAAFGYRVDGPARFGLRVPVFAPAWLATDRPLAVLVPGASRPEKLWPEACWIEIGRMLAARGLVLAWLWGSPEERDRVRRLAAGCGGTVVDASETGADVRIADPAPTSVVPPFLSVADAAGLVARARLVAGLDTGFTHLAGALGRPTVGIFCDFDATQCAVSGDARCESFGGIGRTPPVADVAGALERMLADPAPMPAS